MLKTIPEHKQLICDACGKDISDLLRWGESAPKLSFYFNKADYQGNSVDAGMEKDFCKSCAWEVREAINDKIGRLIRSASNNG